MTNYKNVDNIEQISMPHLDWIGKSDVLNHDKDVPFRFLKKLKSRSIGDSENLLIEGDNLEALKSIMPYYKGKIKCIYIDPPYNTGNEDWVYNDNVNSPKIRKWLGKVVNQDDLSRHDKWLCMMYPRLKLLKELLHDEGSIFIHISDVEEHHLRSMLSELFGEANFINRITIKTRSPSGFQSVNPGVYETAEYILAYAKNKKIWKYNKQYVKITYDKAYKKVIENKNERIEEWKIKPIKEIVAKHLGYNSSKIALKNIDKCVFDRQVEEYALKNAASVFRETEISNTGASAETVALKMKSKETNHALIQKRENFDDRIIYRGSELSFYSKKIRQIDGEMVPSIQLTNIWTDISWEGIAKEGNVRLKKGKKPIKLIKRIIEMASNDGDIILDSFAGTGTTGDAVLKLNHEKNQRRQFILVELESKIARNTTSRRITDAINSINNTKKYGFAYCTLGNELFTCDGTINPRCTFEQLGSYIFFTETRRPLDHKIAPNPFLGESGGIEYYLFFQSMDKNSTLDFNTLKSLPKETKKVIYADLCRVSENKLEEYNGTFKQIPYDLDMDAL